MDVKRISRRKVLGNAVLGTALCGATVGLPAADRVVERGGGGGSGSINVRDFGAVGDGKADDTNAFRAALKAAGDAGGDVVFVPRGNYLVAGTLEVPEHVTLEGVFRAPTARTQNRGTTLLAVAGGGKADGEPFITLRQNGTLRGLTVFYPEQKQTNPPTPYPWTVRGIGDNCSLVDVLLVNPYQAVDFGTHPAGRHLIRGLYAQALYRGVFVDQCYDVGRIEDVHLWPFWGGWEGDLGKFTREEGVAFVIGRTDWEYMFNCFCIGYKVGFQFVKTKAGSANAVLTQCGSDIGPLAVRVESVQDHAGISFVNGQFMAGVEIKESNRGPVKFTACGFWGIPSTNNHAVLEGRGHTTFNGCHFIGWARTDPGAPCIHAKRGGLTVTACDFAERGKTQIVIESGVDTAIVYGNRLRGEGRITNMAGDRAQVALNCVTDKE